MGAKTKEIARLTGKSEIRVGQILTAGMAIATKEGLALKMLCTASRFFPTSDAAYRFAYLSGLGDEFVDGVFVRIAEYGVSKEAGQQGEGEESGGEEDEDNYLAHVFPTKKPQAQTREGFIALVAFFFIHYRICTTKKLGDQIREEMDTRFPTMDPVTLAARCEFVTTITTMKVLDIGVARVSRARSGIGRGWIRPGCRWTRRRRWQYSSPLSWARRWMRWCGSSREAARSPGPPRTAYSRLKAKLAGPEGESLRTQWYLSFSFFCPKTSVHA